MTLKNKKLLLCLCLRKKKLLHSHSLLSLSLEEKVVALCLVSLKFVIVSDVSEKTTTTENQVSMNTKITN
jgi:hypothetical protein